MSDSRPDKGCPCCGSMDLGVAVSKEVITWESALREAFARRRACGSAGRDDLTDRTAFTHGDAVDLLECGACGLLIRGDVCEDFTAAYADDHYDAEVLRHILQRDVRLFSQKEDTYAHLLPEGARVVEVGSYAGGFLHVAQTWGWDALGIDVGEDVAAFANENGYRTVRGTLEGCRFPASSLDAVFIWNCFDQLPDPNATLAEAQRVLGAGGLLLIRVPNALFYRLCQPLLQYARAQRGGEVVEQTITKVMGYNNLLGFPYQYGYGPAHLQRMTEHHGFQVERIAPSHLMMLPEAEAPGWALEEQRETLGLLTAITDALGAMHADALASPWVELLVRKAISNEQLAMNSL